MNINALATEWIKAMKAKSATKKRIIKICISLLLALTVVFAGGIGYKELSKQNQALEINEYVVMSERLPSAFHGFRIAQVSDLHNAEFGEDNEKLLSALAQTNADAIVLTGDLADSRRTNTDAAVQFAKKAVEIAPAYYVTGNHESRIDEYADLKTDLISCGVTVLENQSVVITKDMQNVRVIGLQDPAFADKWDKDIQKSYLKTQLSKFAVGEEYTILLSHRPEFFDVYAEFQADLVFSGHAHGGQIRLPKIGGLFAPNQGFFPKYDAGLYEKGQTKMLVSRGIGNSLFPLRINNPSEIVVVTLFRET